MVRVRHPGSRSLEGYRAEAAVRTSQRETEQDFLGLLYEVRGDGDAGGDEMIQHVCDRCGSVINPAGSAVFVTVQNGNANAFENKSELCCSCGMWLKRFLECKA